MSPTQQNPNPKTPNQDIPKQDKEQKQGIPIPAQPTNPGKTSSEPRFGQPKR